MEGSFEYNDNRYRKTASYEMLHKASDLDGFFGTTQATENECDIWNMEC
jgi:hypothetical protein